MPPRRPAARVRRAIALVVAGALSISAAALVGGVWLRGSEWWQADRAVSAGAAAELADGGPAPGPTREAWSFDVPLAGGDLAAGSKVSFELAAGELVAVSNRGLEARSARTGHPSWHYFRRGWELTGWAVSGGVVAGWFEAASPPHDKLLVGFDAAGGRELWSRGGLQPVGVSWHSLRAPAAGGVVPVRTGSELAGLDLLHGGRLAWVAPLPAGCSPVASAAGAASGDARTLALTLGCGARRAVVLALDPRDGRRLWARELELSPLDVTVSVGGGMAAVGAAGRRGLDVVGRDGRLLLRDDQPFCDPACQAVPVAGEVIFHPVTFNSPSTALGPDGAVRWRRVLPMGETAVAGGRLYVFSRGDLAPATLSTVDPGSGAASTSPLPFAFAYLGLTSPDPWLGAGGGMAFTAYPSPRSGAGGGLHVVALVPAQGPAEAGRAGLAGPLELGGVPAAEWPDACALLAPADLARVAPGVGFSAAVAGRAGVGRVSLPRPVACRYDSRRYLVSASIDWVSADVGQARRLFASTLAADPGGRLLPGLGDQAFEASGAAVVRVGRFQLTVSVFPADQAAADALARIAAERLLTLP